MSFIYPRVIKVTRPGPQAGIGHVGYGGQIATAETLVIDGVPASIQLKKEGGAPDPDLPADASKRPFWNIFFNLPLGTVKRRDIVTDDRGIRYQVQADYWNSLGYNCLCEELEA